MPAGVEENDPGPDIDAYNPVGPSVAYERAYRSSRGTGNFSSAGLSYGWTDNYSATVTSTATGSWGPLVLTYPNGATETWTPVLNSSSAPTGAFTLPPGTPYVVTGVVGGTQGYWQNLTITSGDLSKLVFAPDTASPTVYRLWRIVNPVGHYVTINRDLSMTAAIDTIVNDAGTTLLSFTYSGSNLQSIQDAYGRIVTYTFSLPSDGSLVFPTLRGVSQIGPVTSPPTTMPARWQYDYIGINSNPYLTSIKAPNPIGSGMSESTTSYDTTGRVTQHTDANGLSHMFEFHPTNTVVRVKDSLSNITQKWIERFGPSQHNVGTATTDAYGYSARAAYNDPANPYMPSKATDELGNSSGATYDAFGNMLTGTDPRGVEVTNTYDYPTWRPTGQLRATQVATATQSIASTSFEYYGVAQGGFVSIIHEPKPGTVNSTITSDTYFNYDTLGNVTGVTPPYPSPAVAYTYTSSAQPSEAVGEPVKITASGTNPVTGLVDSETEYFGYDARGNVTSETDALGRETDYVYNLADQVTNIYEPPTDPTQPANRVMMQYNYLYPGGPVTSEQVFSEGNSVTPYREVDYHYGAEGELLSVSGDTYPESYTYDGQYRTRTVADGKGDQTYYDYDPVGNLIQVSYPREAGAYDTESYAYDPAGDLTKRIDGKGVETDYYYDPTSSLLTTVHYPGAQIADVGYSYDSLGRLQSMTDGTGTTSYQVDDNGNPLSITRSFNGGPQNQTISYDYLANGARYHMYLPLNFSRAPYAWPNNQPVQYGYDGVGRLSQITYPWGNAGLEYYSYNADGSLKQVLHSNASNGNGTTNWINVARTLYTYNGRNLLSSIENDGIDASGNVTQLSLYGGMSYDAVGNRLGETATIPAVGDVPDASHTVSYAYDRLNELVSEQSTWTSPSQLGFNYGATYNWLFGYDLVGNPTTFRGNTDSFNADNQSNSLSYDGNGNPSTLFGQSATFDPENRLIAGNIAGSYNNPWSAGYDGDGLRAWQSPSAYGSVPSFFLYDGDAPVVEEGPDGSLLSADMFGLDGPQVQYVPGYNYFNQQNGTNDETVLNTFDPQGSLVQRLSVQTNPDYSQFAGVHDTRVYDAFGGLRGMYGTTGQAGMGLSGLYPTFGFGGQYGYYTDRWTGLVLMTHRHYDPSTGRFITRDPTGYRGGIGLYAFCGNNPVTDGDPSGYGGPLLTPLQRKVRDQYNAEYIRKHPHWEEEGAEHIIGYLGALTSVADGVSITAGIGAGIKYLSEVGLKDAFSAGAKRAGARLRAPRSLKMQRGMAKYGHLKDSKYVGEGKDFTAAQKRKILEENARLNGGVMKSDKSGIDLVKSGKSKSGVTPPSNEAQVDHIIPRNPADPAAPRGTNSYSNAQVLSRAENRLKSNK